MDMNKEQAFTILLEYEQKSLATAKETLAHDLGVVTSRLLQLEALERQEVLPPVQMTTSAAWQEFQDDGYMGGYVSDYHYPAHTFEIFTSSFTAAYLGTLASQSHPIPCVIHPTSLSGNYLAITLKKINLQGEPPQKAPRDICIDFNHIEDYANILVEKLREEVIQANPYKNIPIKINESELIDALLRKRILEYCHEIDPNFSLNVM